MDAAFRRQMCQLHTDLHIVNALAFQAFDGALVTGAQIGDDGTARIDLDLPGRRQRPPAGARAGHQRRDPPGPRRPPGLRPDRGRPRRARAPPQPLGRPAAPARRHHPRDRDRGARPPGVRGHAPRLDRPVPAGAHPQGRQQGPPQPADQDRPGGLSCSDGFRPAGSGSEPAAARAGPRAREQPAHVPRVGHLAVVLGARSRAPRRALSSDQNARVFPLIPYATSHGTPWAFRTSGVSIARRTSWRRSRVESQAPRSRLKLASPDAPGPDVLLARASRGSGGPRRPAARRCGGAPPRASARGSRTRRRTPAARTPPSPSRRSCRTAAGPPARPARAAPGGRARARTSPPRGSSWPPRRAARPRRARSGRRSGPCGRWRARSRTSRARRDRRPTRPSSAPRVGGSRDEGRRPRPGRGAVASAVRIGEIGHDHAGHAPPARVRRPRVHQPQCVAPPEIRQELRRHVPARPRHQHRPLPRHRVSPRLAAHRPPAPGATADRAGARAGILPRARRAAAGRGVESAPWRRRSTSRRTAAR